MKLKWGRQALADLARIDDYIAQFNPGAAKRITREITLAAKRLKSFPQFGRAAHRSALRLLQVPGRPYLLPYRVSNDTVEILAVIDERMERPPEWL